MYKISFHKLLNRMALLEKMGLSGVPFKLYWGNGTPNLKIG
jgi:predicted transcriptional regulator